MRLYPHPDMQSRLLDSFGVSVRNLSAFLSSLARLVQSYRGENATQGRTGAATAMQLRLRGSTLAIGPSRSGAAENSESSTTRRTLTSPASGTRRTLSSSLQESDRASSWFSNSPPIQDIPPGWRKPERPSSERRQRRDFSTSWPTRSISDATGIPRSAKSI